MTETIDSPLIRIGVDFDGTIALADTTDALLEAHAAPAWRDVEAAWRSGSIGSRECMARQVELLRIAPVDLDRFADDVAIDPAFPAFVDACRSLGLPVVVLSDGLDRVIAGALARCGLDLPIRANALTSVGGDRWRLDFPYADDACLSQAGHCKCRSLGEGASVLVGDGRSDFCAAAQASVVFAKDELLAHRRATHAPHIPFAGFGDVASALPGVVARLRDTLAADPLLMDAPYAQ